MSARCLPVPESQSCPKARMVRTVISLPSLTRNSAVCYGAISRHQLLALSLLYIMQRKRK